MKKRNKAICLKIREVRRSMKLTQSRFAEIVDLSEDSIGKIERCVTTPKIETLYQIARKLSLPIDTFLSSGSEGDSTNGLPDEIQDLVYYLRTRPAQDAKLLHDLAIRIFERKA